MTISLMRMQRIERAISKKGVVIKKIQEREGKIWKIFNEENSLNWGISVTNAEMEMLHNRGLLIWETDSSHYCVKLEWGDNGKELNKEAARDCNGRALDLPSQNWPVCLAGNRFPRSGFLRLVMLAKRKKGPLSLRDVQAAMCFLRDIELTRAQTGLVMDWENIATIRQGVSVGNREDKSLNKLAATHRLDQLAKLLEKRTFSLVHAACVEHLSLIGLERRFCLKPRSAGTVLSDALTQMADAYDFKISGGRY